MKNKKLLLAALGGAGLLVSFAANSQIYMHRDASGNLVYSPFPSKGAKPIIADPPRPNSRHDIREIADGNSRDSGPFTISIDVNSIKKRGATVDFDMLQRFKRDQKGNTIKSIKVYPYAKKTTFRYRTEISHYSVECKADGLVDEKTTYSAFFNHSHKMVTSTKFDSPMIMHYMLTNSLDNILSVVVNIGCNPGRFSALSDVTYLWN